LTAEGFDVILHKSSLTKRCSKHLIEYQKKAWKSSGKDGLEMRKKRTLKSVIVKIIIESISDESFLKLGDKACREDVANIQVPELPDIIFKNTAAFSGKEKIELEEAGKWFWREIEKIKPTSIIFLKTRKRRCPCR
jgi:hypothetical protein